LHVISNNVVAGHRLASQLFIFLKSLFFNLRLH